MPASLTPEQRLAILDADDRAFAIYTTEDIIIEWANDAMIGFWGKDRSIIGLPLEEAVPELKGQPFKHMLQQVLLTGVDNSLSAKSGADFDRAYVKAMVEDHKKDISDFERGAKVAKYDDLRDFINKTLPILKSHLAAIEKIDSQLK